MFRRQNLEDSNIIFSNTRNTKLPSNQSIFNKFRSSGLNRKLDCDYSSRTNQDQSISLLSDTCDYNIFTYMARDFTITTKNSSGQFNIEFLKNTSSVISEHLNENPTILQYHIDIMDDENVISKFVQMYQGELTEFDEDDLPVVRKITNELKLYCCPLFMKPKSLTNSRVSQIIGNNNLDLTVKITQLSLENYLQKDTLKTFTIHTHKQEYKCNIFGILSSSVIRESIQKEPNLDHYNYDYNDDENEFQLICDVFNFNKIKLTKDNVFILNEICKDLKIECVLKLTDKFIIDSEKVSQTIDD